eukprot:2701061-Pleurochrysis_carterae.AAC.1
MSDFDMPSLTHILSLIFQILTGRPGTPRPVTFSCTARRPSRGQARSKRLSLSSCEAEIVAAFEAAKEAVYLRSLLAELGSPATEPTSLSLDNKSAIDL